MAVKWNRDQTGHKYLSSETVTRQERKATKAKRWGLGLLIFFVLALFGTFLPENEPTGTSTIVLIIIGIAAGAVLLAKGLLNSRETETARQYEQLFMGDRDGVVTLREIADLRGKPAETVRRELESLFAKNYYTGCVLRRSGEPAVLINDAQVQERGFGFVSVQCATCGGVSRIRAGSRGKCQFCGAPIADKGV